MSNKISSISIVNFRGATQQFKCDFETAKKISLIFGENGSGKSTLVDALDFVFNEKIGFLGQVSIGHNPHKYLSSLGTQLQDLVVEAEINSNTIRGTISNSGEIITTKPDHLPSVEILRRNQILNIILAEPKNRFAEIKKFIDVQKCQKNEDTLRNAKDNIKIERDDAEKYYLIADEQLKKIWEEDGKKSTNYLNWASEQSKYDSTEVEDYITKADLFITRLENCSNGLSEIENSYSAIEILHTELTATEISYEEVKKDLIKNADQLIDTLDKAKIYIEVTPELTKCPVCEKPNTQSDLLEQVTERLNSYNKPITLKKKIEELRKKFETKQIQYASQKNAVLKKLIDLISHTKESDIKEIKKLNIDWNQHPLVLSSFEKLDENCFDEALEIYNVLVKSKDSIKSQLDTYKTIVKRLADINRNLHLLHEKKEIYDEKLSQLNKLEALLEIAEKIRKEFLDEVLLRISNSIDEYYQKLHPDENIGSIKCSMKSHGINSMEIVGKFHSVIECPPAAYYSESHLDTLGICIFIALAKHYNINGTIIVFDDVLTSVDVNHLQRFITFLSDISQEFNQIIVTTHYRLWREKYRYAKGPSANVDLIELNNWSLVKGLNIVRSISSLEELYFYLKDENFHRNITSMFAGVMLESLLNHIVYTYNCKVGIRSVQEPTIADLFYAIENKHRKIFFVEKVKDDGTIERTELKPFFDLLEINNMIRNKVGAHYSELGMELPDAEVRNFGNVVKSFAETLICQKCGEIPHSDRSGSYRECHCGSKRMHPLQLPK